MLDSNFHASETRFIKTRLDSYRQHSPPSHEAIIHDGNINTLTIILSCLHASKLTQTHISYLLQLERQLNHSKKIYLRYTTHWTPLKESGLLADEWIPLLTAVLYSFFLSELSLNNKSTTALKLLNTLFKCLELPSSVDTNADSPLYQHIRHTLHHINPLPHLHTTTPTDAPPTPHTRTLSPLKTIPLTVLFSEGPIARAYLATLYDMGYAPEKIIHMLPSHDTVTKKALGRMLPKTLRHRYAAFVQRLRMFYWPRTLSQKYPKLKEAIFNTIETDYHFAKSTLSAASQLAPLSQYSTTVEPLLVKNLNDPLLATYLKQHPPATLLYTGGGIVPELLIDIPTLTILHIHPGHLPLMRGADCTLWSSLLYGTNAASAFFMDKGIDTGHILLSSWLPKVNFKISHHDYDLNILYQSIYSYFDPWVRSFVLRQLITQDPMLDQIKTTKQKIEEGTTYHFMHDQLKELALNSLFTKKGAS